MTDGGADGDVLDRLEATIVRLADERAPLDELVAAHERAVKLLAEAEAELQRLRERTEELGRLLSQ
jgi:exodeoxyribonuclease VII small subunit